MSEDMRKNCRTQGKYSDKGPYYDDKRPQKFRDKRQKVSPAAKEPQEKKFRKRTSDGSKGANTSSSNEGESPLRYLDNSDHSFSQLEDLKKSIEIRTPGKHVISDTENGESIVFYEPEFFEEEQAEDLMDRIEDTTNWFKKNIVIHGLEYSQPRLVAWYGPFPYSYSGATLEPAEMPDCIVWIKKKVEEYLKSQNIDVVLNSVLLNLYRNNKDSVAWHSDDELTMGVCPTIASVSLGETRKFEMRRKMKHNDSDSFTSKGDEYFVHLTHGSLLIMDGCMQEDWQHRVPKEYHDRERRINLTFRTVFKLESVPRSLDTRSKKHLPVDKTFKKSYGNKINLDEDFPPLKSDTNPVGSGIITSSPQDRTGNLSSSLKTDKQFSNSYKSWNSSISKTPLRNSVEIIESEEEWELDPPPPSNYTQKTGSKINESCEELNVEPVSCVKTPLGADELSGSYERCDSVSSHNKISFKTDNERNRSEEKCEIQPSCNKSNLLNNLNDDRENIKIDMQNKNLNPYDSNLSSDNAVNVNAEENKNFSMNENSSVNNRHGKEVKNKPASSAVDRWKPNIEAKVFVPIKKFTTPSNDDFSSFRLEHLVKYNIDSMSRESFFAYAVTLKIRVLEKIHEFKYPENEDLDFLCEITDGSQNERNQRLITARMAKVASKAFVRSRTSPNVQKSFGNPRQYNHGNQSYSERMYQGRSSRGSYHKH